MKRRKKLLILTGALIVLSLQVSGCSNNGAFVSEAYQIGNEALKEVASEEELQAVLEEVTTLINYRGKPFELGDLEGKFSRISSKTLSEFKWRVDVAGDKPYYDVDDFYKEIKGYVEEEIASLGGEINWETGEITYPNGKKEKVIESVDFSDYEEDGDSEEAREREEGGQALENGQALEKLEMPNESEESLEGEKTEAVESEEDILEETEAIEETSEAAEEETSAVENESLNGWENDWSVIETEPSSEEYVDNREPVGVDSEGFEIDVDGNVCIVIGSGGLDPRMTSVVDLNGKVLWKGVPRSKIHLLTDEDNREYLRACRVYEGQIRDKVAEDIENVHEQGRKNEEVPENLDDGLGNGEWENQVETEYVEYPSSLMERYKTSSSIKEVDGKHVIDWKDIINGYNLETGRYRYEIFGRVRYVDLNKTYIPISVFAGDIRYDFKLMDYRLLDNGKLLMFYESRNKEGGLAYSLEVSGEIRDGKFEADDIEVFTSLYNN